MKCSCIRYFDFDITETTCKDIYFQDRSTFQEGVGFDTGYELIITFPDGTTQTKEVRVGQRIKLDFGGCIPAGVFNFSTETCGEKFDKDFPILCTLECGWLRATAKLGKGVDVTVIRSIRENIDYIKPLVSYGDIDSAISLVDDVERELRKIECECTCG